MRTYSWFYWNPYTRRWQWIGEVLWVPTFESYSSSTPGVQATLEEARE